MKGSFNVLGSVCCSSHRFGFADWLRLVLFEEKVTSGRARLAGFVMRERTSRLRALSFAMVDFSPVSDLGTHAPGSTNPGKERPDISRGVAPLPAQAARVSTGTKVWRGMRHIDPTSRPVRGQQLSQI